MTVKTSVSLSDEQDRYARSLVDAGKFPSVSAVVQHGIELLREDRERRDAELEALRTLIDDRRRGPFIDLDAGEADIRATLAAKRSGRAAL